VGFLVEPQNQGWTVCEWFGLKTIWTVFTSLASKLVATVSSGLTSKPTAVVFDGLASKSMATVSSSLASKPAVNFLVEPQNRRSISWLSLKTGSFGLVIWASKSPRRFLGLGLKTKWASICRLRHKTDRWWSAWDTRQDPATCLTWKQVWLGFPSLA
jgi:hypothetical protein